MFLDWIVALKRYWALYLIEGIGIEWDWIEGSGVELRGMLC